MPERNSEASADQVSQPILAWLSRPAESDVEANITLLHAHLRALSKATLAPAQMQRLLTLMQPRTDEIARAASGRLEKTHLPLSGRVRNLVKVLQAALEMLAGLYFSETQTHERLVKGLQRPQEASFWLALNCLRRHLMLSNRAASPHGPGIWSLAHRVYEGALAAGVLESTPAGGDCSVQQLYTRMLLVGCPHPASFAGLEWRFVDAYLARHVDKVRVSGNPPVNEQTGFWISRRQDQAPIAIARKPFPESSSVLCLDMAALDAIIAEQLQLLSGAHTAKEIGLPTVLSDRATVAVLKRLRSIFVHPAKRRFPRRRQGYRARICFRLDAIWQLLRGQRDDSELSEWQVVNESPDGYATMHVSGRTQKMHVGDLAAIRRYHDDDWQICIVRWALSENPEHFELGLQALAAHAIPTLLALPGPLEIEKQPALLMPPLAGLRNRSALAISPGLSLDPSCKQVLIAEGGNLVIHEVKLRELVESTPGADIYLVDDDRDT